jgi:hypothetical protein
MTPIVATAEVDRPAPDVLAYATDPPGSGSGRRENRAERRWRID